MRTLHKIASGAAFFLAGSLFQRLAGLIYRLIAAHAGKEVYGLFTLGFSVFEIGTTIALLGFNAGLVRLISFYHGKNDTAKINTTIASAFSISGGTSILVGITVYLCAKLLALNIFHDVRLISALKLFALSIPFWIATTVFVNVPLGFQKVKPFVSVRHFGEPITKLLFVLLFLFYGMRLNGIMLAFFASQACALILAFSFFTKLFPLRVLAAKPALEIVKDSLPVFLITATWASLSRMDSLLIGYFRTPAAVGIYGAAFTLVGILFLVPFALMALFLPAATTLFSKGQNIQPLYKAVGRWITLCNLPFSILLFSCANEIVFVLFGTEYSAAATPLRILCWAYFIASYLHPKIYILLVYRKLRLLAAGTLTFLLLHLSLNAYLIPRHGMLGAAAACCISFSLINLLLELLAHSHIKTFLLDSTTLKPLASGITSALLLKAACLFPFWQSLPAFVSLLLKGSLLNTLYILGLLILQGFHPEDTLILKELKSAAGKWLKGFSR